jgi:putative endonuclease
MTNYELGRRGEDAAVKHLESLGYKIISRNYRNHHHEFDIIAKLRTETIFFEVKSRDAAKGDPAIDALGRRQIRGIKQGMLEYAYRYHLSLESLRLDFIAIDCFLERKEAELRHYKDVY